MNRSIPTGGFVGRDEPSEFGGSPTLARAARTHAAGDRLRNLRRTGNEDQATISDAAADAIWEGLNP